MRALAWVVPALAAGAIAGYLLRSGAPEPDTRVTHTSLVLPAEAPMMVFSYPGACLAISLSGSHVVYCARLAGGAQRLYVRALDNAVAWGLGGTERGAQPFFSPDGQWIGFFTGDGALKKVALAGGTPVTLARGLPFAAYVNGSWLANGRIVFDSWNAGLRTIAADGGSIETFTAPADEWHQFPQPMPGGRVLYTVLGRSSPRVEARPAGGGDPIVVLTNASHARYLESGHLVFVRDRGVMVVPFDPARLTPTGDARPAGLSPMVDSPNAAAPLPQLAVSSEGTLVYAVSPPGAADRTLVVADRRTLGVEDVVRLPDFWSLIALSADGTRLAMAGRADGPVRTSVLDLRSRTATRVGDHVQDAPTAMLWSRDGNRLYVGTFTTDQSTILAYDVQGSTGATTVHQQPGTWINLRDISRDGQTLVYGVVTSTEASSDIWTLNLGASPPRAQAFVATPAMEWGGTIAPNGSWIAYVSNESGSADLYLQRFPAGGAKIRVAEGLGEVGGALWSTDGSELFVHAEGGRTVFSIPVQWEPHPVFGKPAVVQTGSYAGSGDGGLGFAVHPDNRRVFLVREPAAHNQATQIEVVQNWFTEVRRQAATK
jgi:serine/threonine-protein kinase